MKKIRIRNVIVIFLVFLAFFAVASVRAQTADPQPIVNVNFPCPSPGCAPITSDTQITTYIQTFYQFSLWIGGALALGMVVAGGVMRIVSAGSPDKIHEANDMITSAIFGLLLLFGAVLVLNTINPQLTLLKLPTAGEKNTATASLATPPDINCVAPNVLDFGTIPVWNGVQQYSSLNCIYRRDVLTNSSYNGATFLAGDGTYYSADFTMPNKSIVWLYPYFTKGSDPTATAKCLVYAYKEPGVSSTVQMTPLNTGLQLCAPEYQSLEGPTCAEWTYTGVDDSGNTVTYKIPVSSSTFSYPDPNGVPPIESTTTIDQMGMLVNKDFCVGSDGKADTSKYCTQSGNTPLWQCSILQKPTPAVQGNNVVINACSGSCVDIPGNTGFNVNANPCDKTINNSSLNTDGSCRLNPDFVKLLQSFNTKMENAKITWHITEAWPPTVHHDSYCHSDGECADIALTGSSITCPNVKKTMDILKSVSLSRSLNEYKGCGGTTYNTTTGDNIHVQQ